MISELARTIIERARRSRASWIPSGQRESTIDVPPLREIEAEYVRYVLELAGGNISRAADALGLYRSSLQRRLRTMGKR